MARCRWPNTAKHVILRAHPARVGRSICFRPTPTGLGEPISSVSRCKQDKPNKQWLRSSRGYERGPGRPRKECDPEHTVAPPQPRRRPPPLHPARPRKCPASGRPLTPPAGTVQSTCSLLEEKCIVYYAGAVLARKRGVQNVYRGPGVPGQGVCQTVGAEGHRTTSATIVGGPHRRQYLGGEFSGKAREHRTLAKRALEAVVLRLNVGAGIWAKRGGLFSWLLGPPCSSSRKLEAFLAHKTHVTLWSPNYYLIYYKIH